MHIKSRTKSNARLIQLSHHPVQIIEREDVYQEALSLVLMHAKGDSEKPFNPKWSTITSHLLFPVVHRGAIER